MCRGLANSTPESVGSNTPFMLRSKAREMPAQSKNISCFQMPASCFTKFAPAWHVACLYGPEPNTMFGFIPKPYPSFLGKLQ
jgi:hypothetical protein